MPIKKINKPILLWTIIYIASILLITGILRIFNLTFLNWVKYFSMFVCFVGIILGTIQLLKKRKVLTVIIVIVEIVIILVVDLYCLLLFDIETLVIKDNNLMIKKTHSILLSNWIEYYDYINIFVRSRQERIYEAYDDSLNEYLYTYYYDENGNLINKEQP